MHAVHTRVHRELARCFIGAKEGHAIEGSVTFENSSGFFLKCVQVGVTEKDVDEGL